MSKPILHMPDVTMIHDGVILALWKEKMDTFEIAKKLGLRESQVANRLRFIREIQGHPRHLAEHS